MIQIALIVNKDGPILWDDLWILWIIIILGFVAEKLTSDNLFQDDHQQEWAGRIEELISDLKEELKKLDDSLKLTEEKIDNLKNEYLAHTCDYKIFYECSCGELIEESEVEFGEDGGIWCPKYNFLSDYRERQMSYHSQQKLVEVDSDTGWKY